MKLIVKIKDLLDPERRKEKSEWSKQFCEMIDNAIYEAITKDEIKPRRIDNAPKPNVPFP